MQIYTIIISDVHEFFVGCDLLSGKVTFTYILFILGANTPEVQLLDEYKYCFRQIFQISSPSYPCKSTELHSSKNP